MAAVEPEETGVRYGLLMAADGRLLAAGEGGGLVVTAEASDAACWLVEPGDAGAAPAAPPRKRWMRKQPAKPAATASPATFRHPTHGLSIEGSAAQADPLGAVAGDEGLLGGAGLAAAYTLQADGAAIGAAGERLPAGRPGASFRLLRGPDRLPSEYLVMMRDTGYCVMPALMPPSSVEALRRAYALDGQAAPDGQAATATVARTLTHPVVAWLTRMYMAEEEVRLGAGPSLVTLQPGQNADGVGGWHSDFPCACTGPSSLPPPRHPRPPPPAYLRGPSADAASHTFSEG